MPVLDQLGDPLLPQGPVRGREEQGGLQGEVRLRAGPADDLGAVQRHRRVLHPRHRSCTAPTSRARWRRSGWPHVSQAGRPALVLDPSRQGDHRRRRARRGAGLLRRPVHATSPAGAAQVDWAAAQNLFNQGKTRHDPVLGPRLPADPEGPPVYGKVGVAPMIGGPAGVAGIPGPWYLSVPRGRQDARRPRSSSSSPTTTTSSHPVTASAWPPESRRSSATRTSGLRVVRAAHRNAALARRRSAPRRRRRNGSRSWTRCWSRCSRRRRPGRDTADYVGLRRLNRSPAPQRTNK